MNKYYFELQKDISIVEEININLCQINLFPVKHDKTKRFCTEPSAQKTKKHTIWLKCCNTNY